MGFRLLPCTSKCIKSDWTAYIMILKPFKARHAICQGPQEITSFLEAIYRWRKVGKSPRLLQDCIWRAVCSLSCIHVHLAPLKG